MIHCISNIFTCFLKAKLSVKVHTSFRNGTNNFPEFYNLYKDFCKLSTFFYVRAPILLLKYLKHRNNSRSRLSRTKNIFTKFSSNILPRTLPNKHSGLSVISGINISPALQGKQKATLLTSVVVLNSQSKSGMSSNEYPL